MENVRKKNKESLKVSKFEEKLEKILTEFLHLREDLEDPTASGWIVQEIKQLIRGEVIGHNEIINKVRTQPVSPKWEVREKTVRDKFRQTLRLKLNQ